MAKLTCHGGAGRATGANFLLEIGEKKVLIDCGMEQGGETAHHHNRRAFPYDPASVDLLFVTHAHIDHIGLIPRLVKEGFAGEIYSTQETKEISLLLLEDAAKIGRDNGEPLYDLDHIARAMSLWSTLPYHAPKDFGGFSLELFDAGHILGSAMYQFSTDKGSLLATGDIGNSPSPILKDHEKVSGLSYLLMESVYGDRNHEERSEREAKFKRAVEETIGRGGTLLIPAFSLERTQEILLLLDNLFEKEKLPSAPVYLDSPLAQKITLIFERAKGLDSFNFKELVKIARVAESKDIASTHGAKIIIAGSGMSTAGRILYHEKHFLPDPTSTILMMGYQAAGTLGRQIAEGVDDVVIDGERIHIKARVVKIDGFSGHADSNALVEFAAASQKTLKKILVAMGEPKSQIFLAQRLRDELNLDAVSTEEGRSYELDL